MRFSRLFVPTLRESPGEARNNALALLVRGGYLRALEDGGMAFLPLGGRLLRRLADMAERELDSAGFSEILFPPTSPAGHDFGPDGVELLAARGSDLARRALRSYRNVPQRWFSWSRGAGVDPHFRTASTLLSMWTLAPAFSPLPVHGLTRDLVSRFGLAATEAEATPRAPEGTPQGAEVRILDLPDPDGDLDILCCVSCGARALADVAEGSPSPPASPGFDTDASLAIVFPTPGVRTIRDLASPPFGVPPERQLKSLVFRAGEGLVLAVVRGDDDLSEAKLGYHVRARPIRPATPEEIGPFLGALPGSLGAVGTAGRLPVLVDRSLRGLRGMVTGANRNDHHLRGVDVDRDLGHATFVDLRKAGPGDACPTCGGRLEACRSLALAWKSRWIERPGGGPPGAVLGADGRENPLELSTVVLSLDRLLVRIAAQSADERGFCWPAGLSPFDATILSLGPPDPEIGRACEALEGAIEDAGFSALYDDREERAGVKFADADLVGSPVRLGLGPRGLAAGCAEWRARSGGEVDLVPLGEVARRLSERDAAGQSG